MKSFILFTLFGMIFMAQSKEENPFLIEWNTPFGVPPFEKIKTEHFLPAFEKAIELHNAEIETIVSNKEEPTFENTIAALDRSGETLRRVQRVFNAMNSAMITEELRKVSEKISPMLAAHKDEINLNAKLFERVKSVYANRDKFNLNTEENTLLDKYYKRFIRGGANLNGKKKEEFKKINEELALLSLKFGENVLKETNRFELIIENPDDLHGLPENVIETASNAAEEKGYTGKWLFTIHKPSMIPFLQYSKKRSLREKIYKAYFMKGDHDDELDNKNIIKKIVNLRLQRAKLLGFKNHAEFVLDDQMAKTPSKVFDLLNRLWPAALNRAKAERDEMQKMIYAEGDTFKLKPWDWWYYAEKIKNEKYDLNEDELRPYFQVENVINGVFGLAESLFGIKFVERNDIAKYHPEVRVFEVLESDGRHIGILYADYFPRSTKRAGAWMDEFRRQYKKNGKRISPIIYNVGNFSKPTGNKPALLNLDEVNTLFHEFGHALHGLLSDCTYESISATETPRDFVEFTSQVMENWALNPTVLKKYAKHYKTGETIPDDLIRKIQNASLFNQGFATVEYLAASFLDMYWHTLEEPFDGDVREFENSAMKKLGLIEEIIPRYRSTYFNHIFSGGYSSGYYSYIWSEVLDADAFNYFEQSGDVLNKEIAAKYRKYILSKGGTEDAMELYKKFRGKEPDINPLLKRRGLD